MRFNYDYFNRAEPSRIYVARPGDEVICCLNGVDETSVKYKKENNNQSTISFDVYRYIEVDGELVESQGYQYVLVFMEVYIDDLGFFQLEAPTINSDGNTEYKSVTAISIDGELLQKDLNGFKSNCGTTDSLEYLADNNNNPDTELPKKYISIYNDGTFMSEDSVENTEDDPPPFKYSFNLDRDNQPLNTIAITSYYGTDENVTIPTSINGYRVTAIASMAFSIVNSTRVKRVTIPEGVTTIGGGFIGALGAFGGCKELESVTFPSSLRTIGANAFYGCSSLKQIVLPHGLTEIGNSAFRGCSLATNLYIPDSVLSVGSYAFCGCSKLSRIALPSLIETIPAGMFEGCSSLTEFYCPTNIAQISSRAFNNCIGLKSIHLTSVTTFGSLAFGNCQSLSEITINCVIRSFDDSETGCSFYNSYLSGQRTVLFTNASLNASFIASAFGDTGVVSVVGESDLNITYSLANNRLTVTGYTGTSRDIAIPNSVEYGGETYPVARVINGVFNGRSIRSLFLPENIIEIGAEAFLGCDELEHVSIPTTLTTIGESAFAGCTALDTLCFGYSITDINADAFTKPNTAPCKWYAEQTGDAIYIGKTLYKYRGSAPIQDVIDDISCGVRDIDIGLGQYSITSFAVPPGMTEIPSRLFSAGALETTALKRLVISLQTTRIGSRSFYNCKNLKEVVIPASVTSIGQEAFLGCTGLKYVYVENDSMTIGANAFSGCTCVFVCNSDSNMKRHIDNNSYLRQNGGGWFDPNIGTPENSFTYSINDGEVTITGYTGINHMVIPETINSYRVTKIGSNFVTRNQRLTGVEIPNSVRMIESGAFFSCPSLEKVIIGEDSQLTSIGANAFRDCRFLKEITLPASLFSIFNNAFSGCTELTSIVIPDGVTVIRSNAFRSCSGLVSIEMPDTVREIQPYAFYECASLKKIRLPKSLTVVGERAFSKCTELADVTIPVESAPSFGAGVFQDDTNLIMYCGKRSTAETYAIEQSISYTNLEQLSLLNMAIEKASCGWNVGYVSDSLKAKKYSFNIDNKNIYSFFTQDVSSVIDGVFEFDNTNRVINLYDVADYGADTGITVSYRNLAKSITVETQSDDIHTRYCVSGADDLNINLVNFGHSYIENLDWFMNATDENGELIYVSESLANKYSQRKEVIDNIRNQYIAYSITHNRCLEEINALRYRLPSDYCSTDWSSFTTEDLTELISEYENTRDSIALEFTKESGHSVTGGTDVIYQGNFNFVDHSYTTAYSGDKLMPGRVYTIELGTGDDIYTFATTPVIDMESSRLMALAICNNTGTYGLQIVVNPSTSSMTIYDMSKKLAEVSLSVSTCDDRFIRDTKYWYDYAAYQYTIIPSIYVEFFNRAYTIRSSENEITYCKNHEHQFELYGLSELEKLLETYKNQLGLYNTTIEYKNTPSIGDVVYIDALKQLGTVISVRSDNYYIKLTEQSNVDYTERYSNYTSGDIIVNSGIAITSVDYIRRPLTYDELSPEIQAEHNETVYRTVYSKLDDCVNCIVAISDRMVVEEAAISLLEETQDCIKTLMSYPIEMTRLNNTDFDLTDEEIAQINILYHDTEYNNDNIFAVSTDDTVSRVNIERSLLKDASAQLIIESQPQISFSANIDNIFSVPEFRPFLESDDGIFDVGNFIWLCYHDSYHVKLRIKTIEFNPCLKSNDGFSLTFTNFIRRTGECNDFTDVLGKALGSSGTGSSSSGGGGGTSIDYSSEIQRLSKLVNSLYERTTYRSNGLPRVTSDPDNMISSIDIMYARSDDNTAAPEDGWDTQSPEWEDGMYVWQKIITTYSNGDTITSTPICITGATGGDSESLILYTTDYVVMCDSDGNPKNGDEYIIITAILKNSTEDISWSVVNESDVSVPYTPDGDYEIKIQKSVFEDYLQVIVAAEAGELSDMLTIAKVKDGVDGADAYTVVLSNEAHTFAADESAAIEASTTCDIYAYRGHSQVATNVVIDNNNIPNGMTILINNNDSASTSLTIGVTSDMVTTSGVVPIEITVGTNTVITKSFTYTLALKGDRGTEGASLEFKYKNSAEILTQAPTNVSGWSDMMSAAGVGERTYMVQKLTTASQWSVPICISAQDGRAGVDGSDIEYVYYLKNNSSAPDTPSYAGSSLSPGWTPSPQGVASNNMYEYVSVRTKPAGATTWSGFSTPVVWSKWGEKGQDGDGIEYIYYRSNTSTAPRAPTSKTDTGWTDDPQGVTSDYQYEYVSQVKTTHVGGASEVTFSTPVLWAKFAIGGTAKYVVISGDQIFKKNKGETAYSPNNITLTATLYGGLTGYQWHKNNTVISGATDNTLVISPTGNNAQDMGTAMSATYKCSSGDYSDAMTVVKLEDGADGAPGEKGDKGSTGNTGVAGADAYTVVLSNESHTVACNSDGTAKSGETGSDGRATCDIMVYKGAAALTATNSTSPGFGYFGYSISDCVGCTAARTDDDSFYLSGVTAGVDSGYVSVTIYLESDSLTITKRMSFTKSKDGATGATGNSAPTITGVKTQYYVHDSSTIEPAADATWVDELQVPVYYESTNNGVANSYSYCKCTFNNTTGANQNVTLTCINYAEAGYDFGIISKKDKNLAQNYNKDTDATLVLKSFSTGGDNKSDPVNVLLDAVTPGESYITIKYRKDSGINSYNDSFIFTVNCPSGVAYSLTNPSSGYNFVRKEVSVWTRTQTTMSNGATQNSSAKYDEIATNAAKNNVTIGQWCAINDTTKIDGGKIYTGSITAKQIAAGTITAEKIETGALDSTIANIGGWQISSGGIGSAYIKRIESNTYEMHALNILSATTSSAFDTAKEAIVITAASANLSNGIFNATGESWEEFRLDYDGNIVTAGSISADSITAGGTSNGITIGSYTDTINDITYGAIESPSVIAVKVGGDIVAAFDSTGVHTKINYLGSDDNLDDIKTGGIYYQTANDNAITGRNYPVTDQAGWLEVFSVGNGNVLQRYTTLSSSIPGTSGIPEVYVRRHYNHSTSPGWSAWVKI